jgi:hypothetical protein
MFEIISWKIVTAIIVVVGILTWLVRTTETFQKLWNYLSPYIPIMKKRTTIPIKFGWKKEQVYKKLGKPQETTRLYDVFFSHGITVHYDYHTDVVDGVIVGKMKSGISFEGSIYGVKIGDSFDVAKKKLGPNVDWGLPNQDISMAMWNIGESFLITAIIKKPLSKIPEVSLKSDPIYMIIHCIKSSFALYEAIVSVAIQQIRIGERPSLMEDRCVLEVDLHDKLFHEDYNIIAIVPSLFGGAIVHVAFESKKIISFWIYPLGWERPVIRVIAQFEPKKEQKVKE